MIDIDAIQVMSAPYTTPSAITNLTAALGTIDGSVDLAWTAVGNDGMTRHGQQLPGALWHHAHHHTGALGRGYHRN